MSPDPAALTILHYPAPALRARAKPIDRITDEVRTVARRMVELMREAQGIGLAAPQVGLPWRLFIADVPPPADLPPPNSPPAPSFPDSTPGVEFYINPKFSNPTGPAEPYEEGCLSLPDIRGDVLRPPIITISATDLEGRPFSRTAAGLLARCWQHEMDHLDGVLIIDRMTQLSRIKNQSAVRDLERNP